MAGRLKTAPPRLQAVPSRLLAAVNSDSWRAGKTTAERGYGARWQRARLGYLAKHPLCVMCTAQGIVAAASVVDHIAPHHGDQRLFWNRDNWQPLCAPCHDGAKQREEADRRLRLSER